MQKIAQSCQIFLQMGVRGGKSVDWYIKTGIIEETITTVLAGKHPHTKTMFYVGGVQKNTYFRTRGYIRT